MRRKLASRVSNQWRRLAGYVMLALCACVLGLSSESYAQGAGELQQQRPAQLRRQKPLTPAQVKVLREEQIRKQQEEERLKLDQAKAQEELQKKLKKAEEEEKNKAEAERQRANRLYTEPLIKPLPGQRVLGSPVNRPGDKPTSYSVDTHVGMGAPAWGHANTAPLARPAPVLPLVKRARLPMEANQTLLLIRGGGPFPYPGKDGSTFFNRENKLPDKPRGYYREYTVPTAGSPDRGSRRLVVGRGGEIYYTDNHYRSFKLVVN